MHDDNAGHPASTGPPGRGFTTLFLGKSGVGKTTTLNVLFGLKWATDPVVACTKQPTIGTFVRQENPDLNLEAHRVVDLPGVGESLAADLRYLEDYFHWASIADRLVYITQADTRAYKRDQLILQRLLGHFKPGIQFKLALNQVDRLGCDDADEVNMAGGVPSPAQLNNLQAKINDLFDVFNEVLAPAVRLEKADIIPYAARSGWGLGGLRRLFFVEGD